MCGLRKWSVLRGISLRFYTGEIATAVGVNGAGKSTLAKLLTGSLRPDGGTVHTDDLPFYVMQGADYQLFDTSVAGELEIGRSRLSAAQKRQACSPWDCGPTATPILSILSGGEKQRLQIAAASLSEATLIIFDEPASELGVRAMSRVAAFGDLNQIFKEMETCNETLD
ncbi:ATP-binding cassette domain-containing protein [Pseudoramibacter sp. HA2172]|uniref:ATP-binding cassette domain-containing protein n=1 Tax=Pseudoramibacter faecis TaxID=3108534 RepID=UPI002E79FABC|nr:ATP-binding cassette domain-containing protein [Pseudoramibacter sp. HA2172]